ncbi:Uncharacterised protein [Mycobacteroides abscessus subsp. abscessus]|nr:Uncharacterised protein [Mycobacteroides abscessus subsp. abscessus]SHP93558.1 Uncharacterised protein [Mycobacteroides abscessus subsp. abscessus]SHR37609.1 Uncharacterised protein [Mycobacteroides abscessus subsp. abscessus]SHR44075.1 Uncharacterised protein [Mycobacteroides abscessus subsp. abscessus]SHR64906.1 Uncharacterised protein [Mycobacteroides abscessus subsp. abscessus]
MHQWTIGELGFQVGDRHELTLGQLDHVVAPVHDLDLVGLELGDDVPGLVVPVGIEYVGGDVGAFEVAAEHRFGFHEQLAARVRLVGGEVTELRHVDQLVVDDGRALNAAVAHDDARLGGAVAIGDTGIEAGFDEGGQFLGQWGRAAHDCQNTPAEQVFADIGLDIGIKGGQVGRRIKPGTAFNLVAVALEKHVAHTGHECHHGGARKRDVFEQRGHVAGRGKVSQAAAGQGSDQTTASHHMAHWHEIQVDQRNFGLRAQRVGPQPGLGDHLFAIGGALGSSGASRGVDHQGQRVGTLLCGEQRRIRQGAPVPDRQGYRVYRNRQAGLGDPVLCGFETFALHVDTGMIVKDGDVPQRRRGEHRFHCRIEQLGAYRQDGRFRFGQDRGPVGCRCAGLQWNRHRAKVDACQVDSGVVHAGEAEHRDEVPGPYRSGGIVVPGGGQRAGHAPQLSVGDRLELGQRAQRRTAGGVGDELLDSVPERRTVRVPVHDRGDHLGETQTRLGDGGINRGIGLGGTELLIVGE